MGRNQKNKEKGNGEGTLYVSSRTGLLVGQYCYKGKRKSVYQKKNEKPSEFKKRFNKIIADINSGTYIEKSKDTCLFIIENYVEQKHIDGITSDRSYLRDLETIEQLKKTCDNWINKYVSEVDPEDIEMSKGKIREYSNNTIDKIWTAINNIFKIAVSRRKILYNPMLDEKLTKPISLKETVPVESLTKKEENKLIDVLEKSNHKYKDILLLQLYTGARIGEILALSKDCINLEENTITIYRTVTRTFKKDGDKRIEKRVLGAHTKTYNKRTGVDKGKRTFPMTQKVKKIILKIMSNKIDNINNLLFWNPKTGNIISDGSINSYLDRLNEKEKITDKLHTHKLRHTFITRCQESGMPLVVIQSLVGHIEGSTITSNVYTSVSLEFMKTELNKIAK